MPPAPVAPSTPTPAPTSPGAFNIFTGTTNTAPAPVSTPSVTPASSGNYNIFSGKVTASVAPKTTPAPTASPYFSAVDKIGNSFGFSDQKDTSGKPLFAYRMPGDTSTTTDTTRVATTFDPRVAQPISPSVIQNGRMPQSVSAPIKQALGGKYSDELDHSIALELSGSNQPSNLRVEAGRGGVPGFAPGQSAKFDTEENALAHLVATGQMSLWDAQTKLATDKKAGGDNNPIPFTGLKFNFPAPPDTSNFFSKFLPGSDLSIPKMAPIGGVTTPSVVTAPAPKKSMDFPVGVTTTSLKTPEDFTKEATAINAQGDALKTQLATIDALTAKLHSTKVDTSNQKAVDAYNAQVKDLNTKVDAYKGMVATVQPRYTAYQDAINQTVKAGSQLDAFGKAAAGGQNVPKNLKEIAGDTLGALATPFTPKDITMQTSLSGAWSTLSSSVSDLSDRMQKLSDAKNPVEYGAGIGSVAMGEVNTLFALPGAFIKAAQGIPVIGYLADGISNLFSALGTGGGELGAGAVDRLPVPAAIKDAIRPLVTEVAALVAQIAGGELGAKGLGKIADKTKKIYAALDPAIKDALTFTKVKDLPADTIPSRQYSPIIAKETTEHVAKVGEGPTSAGLSQNMGVHPITADGVAKAHNGTTFESTIKDAKTNTVSDTTPKINDTVTVRKLAGESSPEKYTVTKIYSDGVASLKSVETGKTKNVKTGSLTKVETVEIIKQEPVEKPVSEIQQRLTNAETHLSIIHDTMADHPGRGVGNLTKRTSGEFVKGGDVKYQDRIGQEQSGGGSLDKLGEHSEEYTKLKNEEQAAKNEIARIKTEMKGNEVFARKATALERKSPTAKSKGYNSIPDKPGYEKVYKPYGEQGAGYYYSKDVTVPEVPEKTGGPVVLQAGLNPHFDTFLEHDLKPAYETVTNGIAKTWDFIKKVFNPSARGADAFKTASIMRESLGRMARTKELVYHALDKSRKIFDTYSKEQSLEFIDNLETGKPIAGAEEFTAVMRDALESRWSKIQKIKGTDAYIENYFPHIWKDPAKATEVLSGFGRRPLEGTKSYMKQRTIPTTKEGVALGLEPESYNPVDLIMARVADMDRFIMANDVWTQFKEQGLRQFVKLGGEIPQGWIQVNDKISRSFEFSPEEKGMILRGNWYMPEPAANVVNNYLSPGLTNNPLYNAFRMMGNALNQVQLGFSGYHALFTSGDAIVSKAALELQKGTFTSIAKALASPVTAPYFLWKNLTRGNALLKDYFAKNPEVPDLVDALERAGGRVKMDSFYLNDAVGNFMKAIRSENPLGALIRAPGAIIETLARPIMQELVPRQKLGVFSDMAKTILEQAQKENWSEYKTTLRLQEGWDSVDNRMGQLVYDNLFWNKVVKDMGMVATRSLGWNLGTFRELGGGAVDFAKLPGKLLAGEGRMTPKMAYTLALPYVVGVWGAGIYYLYNHKAPESLLDYYYPTTGKIKPDGTPERISIPSYMKDVFAYKAEGLQTIANKIHPEISTLIAMMKNKDYYGTEIRNPNDPLVKQMEELATYQATQFVPFTITNLMQRQKLGGSWGEYLQSFVGITPAPAYITRSPLQTEIYSLYDKRFGGGVQSAAQTDIAKQKAEVRTLYLTGKTDEANKALDTLVALGIVKDTKSFIKQADIPNDVKLFTQLASVDQEALIKKMELYQLARYAWYVHNDLKAKFGSLSTNANNFVTMEKAGDVKEPTWVKGQDTNSNAAPEK